MIPNPRQQRGSQVAQPPHTGPRPAAARAQNQGGLRPFHLDEDQFFVPLNGWPLFDIYRDLFFAKVNDAGDLIYAHRGFLIECGKHKEIVCAACGGFGHHSRVCPTLVRLRKVALGNTLSQRLLGKALDAAQPNLALNGKDPKTGTNVPYARSSRGSKRSRH